MDDIFIYSEDKSTIIGVKDKTVEYLSIPDNVSKIKDHAFDECISLKRIEVDPENKHFSSIEGILYNKECSKLVRVPLSYNGEYKMPDNVNEVESSCFAGCNSLTSITINISVEDLKCSKYLAGLEALSNISVNPLNSHYQSFDGVLYDKPLSTLLSCPKKKGGKLSIPEGVETISRDAFFTNQEIEYISFPRSLRLLKALKYQSCILSCTGLKHIDVDKENASFSSCDGVLYDKELTTIIRYPANKKNGYSIPLGIKEIGWHAFSYAKYLQNITIPKSVRKINGCAFLRSSLEYVKISEGVETIGINAFGKCHLLEMAEIPQGVHSMFNVFSECENLKNVVFAGAPKEIKNCFEGCISIKEPIITHKKLIHIPEEFRGVYQLPGYIKVIKESAFSHCNLEEIVIPDSVEIIEDNAFCGAKSLKKIRLSSSLSEIGKGAFWNCTELESITIPNGINKINDSVFGWCRSLKTVKLPKTLEYIGVDAFNGCQNLENIIMPESLQELAERAFYGCSNLKLIRVPFGVEKIKSKTFYGCKSINSISIPKSVKTISTDAFADAEVKHADMPEGWDSKRSNLGLPPAPYRPITYNNYPRNRGAYTYGRISPCPYCGSHAVNSYADGTAECESCGGEYRYA